MALKVGANTPLYLHGDHLSSTSATTNSAGTSTSSQLYYAYGGIRATTGSVPTDFGFTGQRRDASANLMYYNARYYDTTLGRFISADTMVPSPKNPQALNRYTYAYNNPLKFVDPTGHCNSLSGFFDPCTFGYEAIVQDAYALFTFLAEATVIGTAYAPAENGQTYDIDALEESRDARWYQGILFDAYDPADYAQTIDACTSGDCDPWRIGGTLVPLVSGGLSSKIGREILKQSLKERIASLPRHIHHIASDKSSKWTKEYERIIKPFGLDLDDSWNKIADYPHKRGWFGGGGHPDAYHQWVLGQMREIARIARGDKEKFLQLYQERVWSYVQDNPEMLFDEWWQ